MNSSYPTNGFTLLELLIALAIFSVMAVMAYGGVRLVIDGSQQLEHAADSLSSLQRTFLFLQQDIQQAVPRGVRDEFGSQEDAFACCTGEKLLQLTRGGVNGVIIGGSNLRRVEYYLVAGRLERRIWPILDRVQEGNPRRLRLMENVRGIEITVLGYGDSEWQSLTPSESSEAAAAVPRAVEVTITTERYGDISRIFVIGS